MFPFDTSVLPQLPTRKALMVIDFQNDFLSADGALPVTNREELVRHTLELVRAFRNVGDIIWVSTEFEKPRAAAAEQILATDAPPKPTILASRLRRRNAAPDDEVNTDADLEAFLSRPGPPIVCAATPGSQFPAAVKEALSPRDMTFTKSHYSAFRSGQLLQMLRAKFITKLFLCGSLVNIGVYATAVDAAKYAYSITLVEDCCGYTSDLRQSNAVRSLVDLTGCDLDDSPGVMGRLESKVSPASPSPVSSPVVPKKIGEARIRKSPIPDDSSSAKSLEEYMAGLKLHNGNHSSASRRVLHQHIEDPGSTGCDVLEVDPGTQPPPQLSTCDDSPSKENSGDRYEKVRPCENAVGTATVPTPKQEWARKELPTLGTAVDETRMLETATGANHKSASTKTTRFKQGADNDMLPPEPLCEGDTTVVHNVLPEPFVNDIFETVRDEVRWQRMSHQGGEVPRLVAAQGDVASDGSTPVYRHPSDESPPLLAFSPTVLKIKTEIEKELGHPLNHALIQFYRDGTDYISEHTDKTLDIVKGSFIANVSLGAERTMVFRSKKGGKNPSSGEPFGEESKQRKACRAQLPHNSLCRMGLQTNMRWLHAIRQDKRMDREKTPAELAFSGGRISLTFRHIGTFLDRDGTMIWGQGATGKAKEDAHAVINGQSSEAARMLQAFGTENHSTEFDWDRYYGQGFDVLHISNSPRLCLSDDPVVNLRITLMLAEYGLSYAKGKMSPPCHWKDGEQRAKNHTSAVDITPIKFVDNDAAKSTVEGELAIMLYLDAVHGSTKSGAASLSQPDLAKVLNRFQQGLLLLDKWRRLARDERGQLESHFCKKELAVWDGFAAEADFIAGSTVSLADFAVWPVLHHIVEEYGISSLNSRNTLKEYYERVRAREPTLTLLGETPSYGAEVAETNPTERE
ncbi:isochorismatase [Colletotrichum plurivorum]|uniref:Isochorismatase n=1 Tax=Colletotrichum plurivorum TaxID=2175906 RepID=A0A8H6N8Y8_9PEZI|nr:isochorismatase [Colletotrichum plurivorum]